MAVHDPAGEGGGGSGGGGGLFVPSTDGPEATFVADVSEPVGGYHTRRQMSDLAQRPLSFSAFSRSFSLTLSLAASPYVQGDPFSFFPLSFSGSFAIC